METIIWEILTVVWFFLPAALANASGTLSNKVPLLKNLNYPMDFGFQWRGIRIFGENKRFRGLILGTIVGTLVFAGQKFLFKEVDFFSDYLRIDYNDLVIWLGALLGAAALIGDAVKSFFKRRVGIKPGGEWPVFDQIDFITAAVLVSLPFQLFAWYGYAVLFAIFIFSHKFSNQLAFRLGLKDVPY